MSLVIEEWIPVREKVGNSRQRSKKDFSSQGRVVTIGSVSIVRVCVCVGGMVEAVLTGTRHLLCRKGTLHAVEITP